MLTHTIAYRFYPDILDQIRDAQERDLRDYRRRSTNYPFDSPVSTPTPYSTQTSSTSTTQTASATSSITSHSHRPHRTDHTSLAPSDPSLRRPSSLRHRIRAYRDTRARTGLDSHTEGFFPLPPIHTYQPCPSDTHLANEFGGAAEMSRPGHARPTHIPLPARGHTPTGSPLQTPAIAGAASPTSPRHSFLGFMRGRGRSATVTHSNTGANSPTLERSNPMTATASRGGSSREASVGPIAAEGGGGVVTRSLSTPLSGGLHNGTFTHHAETPTTAVQAPNIQTAPTTATEASAPPYDGPLKTYRIRLVPNLDSHRALAFDPVVRELLPIVVPAGVLPAVAAASVSAVGPLVNGRPPALMLKIGRFTDKTAAQLPVPSGSANADAGGSATLGPNGGRSGPSASLTLAGGGGDVTSGKVAFKSKVVSRSHAEIWCEPGGKFFIRDSASSSGTFLNHIRLSSPNADSRPMMLNDGDVLQLGVDYQGGTEEMFRCVKMRVEIGREWQRGANEFNTNALKQLNALGGPATETKSKAPVEGTPSKKAKASVTDCCICLFSVTVCQSLFIAPCSHVFHYKCIRPLLLQHHPGFSCPLCRTFANLEEDVETEDAWEIASRRASVISRRQSNHSIRLTQPTDSAHDNGSSSSPLNGSGEPGTSIIDFNSATATVDDLVGGESSTASASEEGGMLGSSALARQTTAVGPDTGSNGITSADIDMPEIVREEEEVPLIAPPLHADPNIQGSLAVVNDPEALDRTPVSNATSTSDRPLSIAVPSPINPVTLAELSFSEAATPRNDTFLSTLASGMHQRFDLAEHINGGDVGMEDGHTPTPRAAPLPPAEHDREDIDMMFT